MPGGVGNAKLAIVVGPHAVDIVIMRHETGMSFTAGQQTYRRAVRAVLGERVGLVAGQFDHAQAQLPLVVSAP